MCWINIIIASVNIWEKAKNYQCIEKEKKNKKPERNSVICKKSLDHLRLQIKVKFNNMVVSFPAWFTHKDCYFLWSYWNWGDTKKKESKRWMYWNDPQCKYWQQLELKQK